MPLCLRPTPSKLLHAMLAFLLMLLLAELAYYYRPIAQPLLPRRNQPQSVGKVAMVNGLARMDDRKVERVTQLKPAIKADRTTRTSRANKVPTMSKAKIPKPTSTKTSRLVPTKTIAKTTVEPDQRQARERVQKLQLFKPFVTAAERLVMLHLLERVDRVFRAHNVTYIIYGGTLLGSHRHHGLVPWDDDIDLLVNKTARASLPGILAAAGPGLTLQQAGGHDKIFDANQSKRTSRYPWRWPYLDVSFFEENSTHLWDHMATYSHWFVYPKFIALPTHPRPFERLRLPAPRDTLAFLQLTYGRTGTCLTSAYSHMIEDGMRSGRQPCRKLQQSVPFVHRQPCPEATAGQNAPQCVLETLRLGRRSLRPAVRVEEPAFAINEPFSLRLVKGFTQPPHYPKMSDSDL